MKIFYTLISIVFLPIINLVANANTGFSLDSLLQEMLLQKNVSAKFIEKKNIKGINTPIESTGEFSFISPSTIIKQTNTPQLEVLKIEGNTITVDRKRNIRSFDVHDFPEIAGYFEGFLHLLSGNRSGLEKNYKVKFSGEKNNWKLSLIPQNKSSAVAEIILLGKSAEVYQVNILLSDGDSSTMEILPIEKIN